jgi:hypothetical protein
MAGWASWLRRVIFSCNLVSIFEFEQHGAHRIAATIIEGGDSNDQSLHATFENAAE